MTGERADPLLDGYRRFRATAWPDQADRYRGLARRGQKPTTAVVACSDARVDPQAIFDAEPGDLFIVRNVAGLVPVYAPDGGCHGTSAALEYAVKILKVQRIVILGHDDCDGVHAMIHGPLRNARDFLTPWMDIAEPVMWPIPQFGSAERMEAVLERAVTRLSLDNLRTFPWIARAEIEGRLRLDGLRFEIETGTLTPVGERADSP